MNTYKTKQNFTAWAIIAIIALLALNAYQWYTNSKLKSENTNAQIELLEAEKIQVELDQDYQAALESLEEMRGDNKELNILIDSQKAELATQKEKINNLIWTKRELSKAKDEIKNLTSQANGFVAEITKLKEENRFLSESNTNLSSQNTELTTNLAQIQKAKEELAVAKDALTTEKEKLSKNNEKLSVQVDMANAIKINFLEVKGYEVKDDGKTKEKSKAKDIDMIRICFLTETNMVTKAGTKEFFIRYINPMGETVYVESDGSGVLVNKLDNTQVKYTTKGTITYNNEDTNGCIDHYVSNKLPKGLYNVEMYNNGFLCGKGQFKMK
jgi:myosin heavy subunit